MSLEEGGDDILPHALLPIKNPKQLNPDHKYLYSWWRGRRQKGHNL